MIDYPAMNGRLKQIYWLKRLEEGILFSYHVDVVAKARVRNEMILWSMERKVRERAVKGRQVISPLKSYERNK